MAIDGIDEYNKTQDVSKAFSTALAGEGKGMSGALANMAKNLQLIRWCWYVFGPNGSSSWIWNWFNY